MRFMLLRKADRKTEAGVMPDEKLLAVMGNFMESRRARASSFPAASRL